MSATLDTGQIAAILGVSRAHVTDKLTKRAGFPAPVVNLSRKMRRWRECDVMTYAGKRQTRGAS